MGHWPRRTAARWFSGPRYRPKKIEPLSVAGCTSDGIGERKLQAETVRQHIHTTSSRLGVAVSPEIFKILW